MNKGTRYESVSFIDTNNLYNCKNNFIVSDLKAFGMGGAENAFLNTILEASKMGYDVKVYNKIEKEIQVKGIQFLPATEENLKKISSHKIFIQRSIANLNLNLFDGNCTLLLHDQVFDDKRLLKTYLDNNKIFDVAVLSNFQKDLFLLFLHLLYMMM